MSFADELDAEARAAEASSTAAPNEPVVDDGSVDDQPVERASTGENDGTPPGTGPEADARMVPRRALEDEREKRQYERQLRETLERRLQDIESRINATRGQATQQQEEEIPYDRIFEDPKAVFETYSAAFEKKLGSRSMETSREMARAQFDDYDETIELLQTMEVPGIQEAVAKSASPAHTAYRLIKKHQRDMQQRKSSPEVSELQRKLEQTERELAALRGEISRPPSSLAHARGSSPGTSAAVKTVDDVLASAWDNKRW